MPDPILGDDRITARRAEGVATLFRPLRLGAIDVPNRVFMAPMTRMRAGDSGSATTLMARYYAQRASAGLIITEGTFFSSESRGYMGSPGIHTDEQERAWRVVVDAVHAAGGRIALQLLHAGRVSHPDLLAGRLPLTASAIAFDDWVTVRAPDGGLARVDCPIPAAMTASDVKHTLEDIHTAVGRARRIGFDFVELHCAHGYLLHQFLSLASNHRDDDYGGSVAGRARFALEAFDAAAAGWVADRIGVRVSPVGEFCGLVDPDGPDTVLYLAAKLSTRAAYLHVSEPDWVGGPAFPDALRAQIRGVFNGPLVWAGGYTSSKAAEILASGNGDAFAFGRSFLANPDLPHRLANGLALNDADTATLYGGGAHGYTDYPNSNPV